MLLKTAIMGNREWLIVTVATGTIVGLCFFYQEQGKRRKHSLPCRCKDKKMMHTKPIYQSMLNGAEIHVISDGRHWDYVFRKFVRSGQVVGFDAEWFNNKLVSIIQIAVPGHVFVIQMLQFKKIPNSLHNFLKDQSILKVGVGIQQDAKKCCKDHQLHVSPCLDLCNLVESSQTLGLDCSLESLALKKGKGLAGIVESCLGVEMIKDNKIRRGNWEKKNLTVDQVLYAAADAYYARLVYIYLEKIVKQSGFRFDRTVYGKLLIDCMRDGKSESKSQKSKEVKKVKKETKKDIPQRYYMAKEKALDPNGVVSGIFQTQRKLELINEAELRCVPYPFCLLTDQSVLPGGRGDANSFLNAKDEYFLPYNLFGKSWKSLGWQSQKLSKHTLTYDFPFPVEVCAYAIRATSNHSCVALTPTYWTFQGRNSREEEWCLVDIQSQPCWRYHAGYSPGEVPGEIRYFEIASNRQKTMGFIWEREVKSHGKLEWALCAQSKEIEQSYQLWQKDPLQNSSEIVLHINGRDYTISFDEMQQTSWNSGFSRPLRRRENDHKKIESVEFAESTKKFRHYRWVFQKNPSERQSEFSIALCQLEMFGKLTNNDMQILADLEKSNDDCNEIILDEKLLLFCNVRSSSCYTAKTKSSNEIEGATPSPPVDAFSSDPKKYWHSGAEKVTNPWIEIEFPFPAILTEYSIRSRPDGHAKSETPIKWNLLSKSSEAYTNVHTIQETSEWKPHHKQSYPVKCQPSTTFKWEVLQSAKSPCYASFGLELKLKKNSSKR